MANLTFTSTGSTTVKLIAVGRPQQNIFTTNNSSYTLGTVMSLDDGDTVQFSGQGNNLSLNERNYYKFETTGEGTLAISGDLKSLIGNSDYVKNHQFVKLFEGCSNIADISQLVFPTTVADFCYSNMFANCTGLVNASTTLPATTLTRWCYNGMFAGCIALTSAPTIAATKIASVCFFSMFYGCSSLTDAPAILAKNMSGDFTCNGMFRDCTSLSSVTVSITNWSTAQNENKNWLYNVASVGTFTKPTTLASIPEVARPPEGWTIVDTYPNTIIAENQTFVFDAMNENTVTSAIVYVYTGEGEGETVTFTLDSSLLPSGVTFSDGTLSANGLDMNYNTPTYSSVIPITLSTTALDAAPVTISATINLVDIPTATITLSTIPAISWNFDEATTSSINLLQYVTYTTSDVTSANLSTAIIGVLPEGVVYQNGILSASKENLGGNTSSQFSLSAFASDARGKSSNFDLNIEGLAIDYSNMPFTIEAIQNTTVSFTSGVRDPNSIFYNKNNGETTGYCGSTISLNQGDIITFEAPSGTVDGKLFNFTQGSGKYKMYGNLGSLVGYEDTFNSQYFQRMFNGCTGLVDAQNLYITASSLSSNACYAMFSGCTELLTPPKVYSKNLGSNSFAFMLAGCSKLTAACQFPYLQNVTGSQSLASLHDFCSGLVNADYVMDLDNINFKSASYIFRGHFYTCKALKRAPLIKLSSSIDSVFYDMFKYCSSLSAVEVTFPTWPGNSALDNWLRNITTSSNNLFIKPSSLTVTRGYSNIPNNWTVLNRHSDGTLWYVSDSNQETGQYTGDDPYAWHYKRT